MNKIVKIHKNYFPIIIAIKVRLTFIFKAKPRLYLSLSLT